MRQFALLFEQIDQTQSTNEKVARLSDYFSQASSADAAWALFFLSGHRLKRLITGRMLFEWCYEKIHLPPWLVDESYGSVGDTAETIALLLPHREENSVQNTLSLSEWMEQRILPLKELSADEMRTKIFSYWQELSTKEIFMLNKILTGSFRVGVSSLLTLKGLSEALHVSREILSQRVMGNWEPTSEFFDSLKVTDENNKYLNPYPFYLAYPVEGELDKLGPPEDWQAEWKWDGIRGQAVCRGGERALWSRGNELVSHQFPEIVEALKVIPEGTVLDGEILAYHDNHPLPFAELQKRLGRKNVSKSMMEKVPIVFMIYDILEHDNQDIRHLPLVDRRHLFEKYAQAHPKISISPTVQFADWQEILTHRLTATQRATEGLMLKRKDSPYGVGRKKGAWWKYKVDPMTIDAILMYAQGGSGIRANLFTDYTFGVWHGQEIIPIAKAYSGLDKEEIKELDRWIRQNTEEKFGPVRKVKPFYVFEIAFEGIQLSNRHKSGIALRFPRIARWRKDRQAQDSDTLEGIKKTFFEKENN